LEQLAEDLRPIPISRLSTVTGRSGWPSLAITVSGWLSIWKRSE